MTTVSVYMDFGVVYEYEVSNVDKALEHAQAIISSGYRHTPKGSPDVEWFPPPRIFKVKISGGAESTSYQDTSRAT